MGGQKVSRLESLRLELEMLTVYILWEWFVLEWALQMITLHNSVQLSNPFNLELVRDCERTLEKWSESDPCMVMVMSTIVMGPWYPDSMV